MLLRLPVLAAALLAPAFLGAQLPAYRRTAADTLRLREVTIAEATITPPGGGRPTPLTSRQESLVAVAFLPNDSARAWYEELVLEASAGSVTEHPTTTAALRQPFALRVDGRGRAQTLAAPTFPAALNRIADLRHQFDDFFLRLPAAPLRPGLTWTDTLTRQDSVAGGYSRSSSIARYRVERDTVVKGTKGVVVAMTQQVRLVTGGPIEGQPVTAESMLAGTDSGVFVFAPGEGRILGRSRAGDLSGNVTLKGGPQPVVVPQTYKYRSTLEPATLSAAARSIGTALTRFAIPSTTLGASCTGVVGAGAPALHSAADPQGYREIYGVLIGYLGREAMPTADEMEWMSAARYTVRGADRPQPAVVAVQFRDSASAAAVEQALARRAAGRKDLDVARRGAILTLVHAPAVLPAACRGELNSRVARELAR